MVMSWQPEIQTRTNTQYKSYYNPVETKKINFIFMFDFVSSAWSFILFIAATMANGKLMVCMRLRSKMVRFQV